MGTLSLVTGLQFRQFEGECGAVAFIPSNSDTHLLSDAGMQTLAWFGRKLHSMSRNQVIAALLAEGGLDGGGTDVDVLTMDSLLAELLQSGLLVELNS